MRRRAFNVEANVLDNFLSQATLIRTAITLLAQEADCHAPVRDRLAQGIEVLESDGDRLVRENAGSLARASFSCLHRRYEPEDLRALSSRLDDILDAIEEAGFRLNAYQCSQIATGVGMTCASLNTCADSIYLVVQGIVHADGRVLTAPTALVSINLAEEMLRESICKLFSADAGDLVVLANKEIYSSLGRVISSCKSAVKQFELMEPCYA